MIIDWSMNNRRKLVAVSSLISMVFLISCFDDGGGGDPLSPLSPLRVYKNPYTEVDWESDFRLKAQLHDHHGTSQARIAAYDAAGYDAIALSNYSGNRSLSFAWDSRRWPPEDWLPSDFIAGLQNISILLPGAEEVGILTTHVISPFMESYIEVWDAARGGAKQENQYETLPELIRMIQDRNGVPCIAHPWGPVRDVPLDQPLCIEMYSAFGEYRGWMGPAGGFDGNPQALLLKNWDALLQRNQSVIGVAVNDHYGPYSTSSEPGAPRHIWDSGKVIVLAPEKTLAAFKTAFLEGAVLAVKDLGEIKDEFPAVNSVHVYTNGKLIEIDTEGDVRWMSDGMIVGEGSRIDTVSIPLGARYVRAEVSNADGSTVYTQAFHLRPVGDVDGDYDVDETDINLCRALEQGSVTLPTEQVAACVAKENGQAT